MEARITKNMTIGEIVSKYPQTITVMLGYGLHCIGCHVAASETIEDGALSHGLDTKTLNKMLNEMNKAISK